MSTLLEPAAAFTSPGKPALGALALAGEAGRAAIARGHLEPGDVDLLIYAGLYDDEALGEPAVAALLQRDLGINPLPVAAGTGTFSFDVSNGGCGVLSALEIAHGFLASGAAEHVLVVASDAAPGHGIALDFPFAPVGAAVACRWSEGDLGIAAFHWEKAPEEGELLYSRLAWDGHHNRLHVEQDREFDSRAAVWASKAVHSLLAEQRLTDDDVDLVIANPLRAGFREGLFVGTGIDPGKILEVPDGEAIHSAALLVALARAEQQGRLRDARRVLLVSAGAGLTVGAALLLR